MSDPILDKLKKIREDAGVQLAPTKTEQPKPAIEEKEWDQIMKLAGVRKPDPLPAPTHDYGVTSVDEGFQAGWKGLKAGTQYFAGEAAKYLGADEAGERWQGYARQSQAEALPSDNSWSFFLGSLTPSIIPTAGAIALAPFTGGSSIPAAASIIGLSAAAGGMGMMEYEDYKLQKGEEVDPLAKLGVGVAYMGAEAVFERMQLGKLIPKGVKGKLLMRGNIEAAEKAGKDILEKIAKQHPTKYKQILTKLKDGSTTEGYQEAATEMAQIGTQLLYQDEEDRKRTLDEAPKQIAAALIGGSIMGTTLAPISYMAQNKMQNDRRQKAGGVIMAVHGEGGEAVELLSKTKVSEVEGYQAMTMNGEVTFVPTKDITQSVFLTNEQFHSIINNKSEATEQPEVKEPIGVGIYEDQSVTVLGEDGQGDLYVVMPDGEHKHIQKEELKGFATMDQIRALQQQQEEAANQLEEEEIKLLNEEGLIKDPTTGQPIQPSDEGYEDAVNKLKENQDSQTKITFGKGDKRRSAVMNPIGENTFDVAEADGIRVDEMTGTEINELVNQLTKEFQGRGEYTIEAFPTDPSDPTGAMQIVVIGEMAKTEEGQDTLTSEIEPQEPNTEAENVPIEPKNAENEEKVSIEDISEILGGEVEGEVKVRSQQDLENEITRIENEIKSLRQEDGSVPKEDRSRFSELGTEKIKARDLSIRGDLSNSDGIAIRTKPKGLKDNPEVLVGKDAVDAENNIESIIQKGIETNLSLNEIIQQINQEYTFIQTELDWLRRYVRDRIDPTLPEVGNNKQSFPVWRKGKQGNLPEGESKPTENAVESKEEQPTEGKEATTFKMTPIASISTDVDRFQNRDKEFSQDTVDSIVDDYRAGKLNLENIPPILLWRDPKDSKLYVVGGHSRLEAFEILKQSDIQTQELVGLTEAEAIQRGREDNALGTQESLTEQAKLVREWMNEDMSKAEIEKKSKQLFKNNSRLVMAYAALDPSGKAIQTLQQFENNQSGERDRVNRFAKYVGEARLRHSQLTNSHETELFNYLLENENSRTSSQRNFIEYVNEIVHRNSFMGELSDKPLNLKSVKPLTDVEKEQNKRVTEAENDVNKAQRAFNNKVKEIESRRSEEEALAKSEGREPKDVVPTKTAHDVLQKLQDQLAAAQRTLLKVKQETGAVEKAKKSQTSIFGEQEETPVEKPKSRQDKIFEKPTKKELLASEEQKKKEELKKLFKDLDDLAGGQLNIGLDPRMLVKSGEIVKVGTELGFIKFRQFTNFIIENMGETFFRRIFDNFKAAYTAIVSMSNNEHGEDLNALAQSKAEDYIETKEELSDPINLKGQIEDAIEGESQDTKESLAKKIQHVKDNINRVDKINGKKVYHVTFNEEREVLRYNLSSRGNAEDQKYYYPVKYAQIDFKEESKDRKGTNDLLEEKSVKEKVTVTGYYDALKKNNAPMIEYTDSYGVERKTYDPAVRSEYYDRSNETNQPIRYVAELSDGSIVSLDGAIRLTDPERWAKVERKMEGKSKDAKNRILIEETFTRDQIVKEVEALTQEFIDSQNGSTDSVGNIKHKAFAEKQGSLFAGVLLGTDLKLRTGEAVNPQQIAYGYVERIEKQSKKEEKVEKPVLEENKNGGKLTESQPEENDGKPTETKNERDPDKPEQKSRQTTGTDSGNADGRKTGYGIPTETEAQDGKRPALVYATRDNIPIPTERVTPQMYSIMDEHQRFGVNMVLERFEKGGEGFLLADGTGVGKTMQLLAIADQLSKKGKVLIITQNQQVIDGNFVPDAKKIGVSLDNIQIDTYSTLSRKGTIEGEFYAVLFDEAHGLKNATSKKTRNAKKIQATKKLFATATPMDTLEGIAYFAGTVTNQSPEVILRKLGFELRLQKDERGREIPGSGYWTLGDGVSPQEVKRRVLSLRDEIIQDGGMLRREYPHFGEIKEVEWMASPELKRKESEIDKYWDEQVELHRNDNGWIHPKRLMSLMGNRSGELSRTNEASKIDRVEKEIIKDLAAGKHVVVIAEGVNPTEIKGLGEVVSGFHSELGRRLAKDGIEFAQLFGDSNKADEVEKFQSGKVKVALATPQSGGTGINLDDTDGDKPRVMYMVTANYSGNQFDQILGRVSRRNTASPAEIKVMYNDSWSDNRRKEIVHAKIQTLQAIQRGEEAIDDDLEVQGIREDEVPKDEVRSDDTLDAINATISNRGVVALKVGKAVVYRGEPTRAIKDKLKALGAIWNGKRKGWMFKGSDSVNIAAAAQLIQSELPEIKPDPVSVSESDNNLEDDSEVSQVEEIEQQDQVDLFTGTKSEPEPEQSLTEEQINNRLEELNAAAEERMEGIDLTSLPNHTSFDFLTEEEKAERHSLILQLPSSGQQIKEAGERIAERVKSRQEKLFGEEKVEKIQDFGEKIGMARKDTADSGYSMGGGKSKSDKTPGWAKKYKVFEQTGDTELLGWSRVKLEEGKFQLVITNKKRGFKTIKHNIDTEQEALDMIPLVEVSRNHRVYKSRDNKEGYSIFKRWASGKLWEIKSGFATEKEAMEYMATNPVEIIEYKEPRIERPHLDKIERKGVPRRKGSVTPKKFMETFGFRGGEFGNWVAADERQSMLDFAFDAFADMADVLGISPKAISLGGRLAIGFGSRGQGLSGASAHFEADRGVINLTKIHGAGALAHEWFHAFDSYFGMQGRASMKPDEDGVIRAGIKHSRDFLSGDYSNRYVRDEINEAWKEVWNTMRYKTELTKYDTDVADRRYNAALERVLNSLLHSRNHIAEERHYGLRKKPATKEQLAQWDSLVERIKNHEFGEVTKKVTKKKFSMEMEYDVQKQLDKLHKEITGRGLKSIDYHQIRGIETALESRKEALAGETFEKRFPSTFYLGSKEIDRKRASAYWSTNHEMAARAFEAYLWDKMTQAEAQNDYLVHSVSNGLYVYLYDAKPYPEEQERTDINTAFDKLFDVLEEKTEGDNVVLFKVHPATATTSIEHRNEIRQAIKEVTSTWLDDSFVNVVDTVSELPPVLQATIQKKAKDQQVAGVYVGDQVFIITDNARSKEEALKTLAHEAIGHLGFRAFVANQSYNRTDYEGRLNSILTNVYESFREDPLMQQIKKNYGYDFRVSKDRMDAADEFIAATTEGNLSETLWDKIAKLINDVLKSMGLGKPLSKADVKALIRNSKAFVQGNVAGVFERHGTSLRTVFFNLDQRTELFRQSYGDAFYSELETTLEAKLPNAGTAESFTQAIQGMQRKGDFRTAEIEWIGLYEWLSEQKGKLSKDDVIGFAKDNNVQIEEVMKGKLENNPEYQAAIDSLEEMGIVIDEDMDGNFYLWDEGEPLEFEDAPEEAIPHLEVLQKYFNGDRNRFEETKHHQGSYAGQDTEIPGGENYKELLLTMPVRSMEIEPVNEDKFTVEIIKETYSGQVDAKIYYDGKLVSTRYGARETNEELIKNTAKDLGKRRKDSAIREGGYKSSHWNEPNVLTHIRFNEREIDGQKTLFIEEIQSDWHQAGRKKGYKSADAEKKATEALERKNKEQRIAEELYNKMREKLDEVYPTPQNSGAMRDRRRLIQELEDQGLNSIDAKTEFERVFGSSNDRMTQTDFDSVFTLAKQYNNQLRLVGEANSEYGRIKTGVPDAPFKNTWHELAMKRMIRYAAENGFDKVAFTPGEVQNDRYDLSKQVDEIDAFYNLDGTYEIHVSKDGRNVIEEKRVTEEQLEELIGKELAKKIIADTEAQKESFEKGEENLIKTYKGLDLKVGGEGMKGFYDKMLPRYLSKYLKKWDSKVGVDEIDTQTTIHRVGKKFIIQREDGLYYKPKNDFDTWTETKSSALKFDSIEEAKKIAQQQGESNPQDVWSFPITESMKETVLDYGQPMFKQNSDQTESPEFKAWFGDSKVVDESGKPLVVYHGTKNNFSIFDKEKIGQNFDASELGYYFTSKADRDGKSSSASDYAVLPSQKINRDKAKGIDVSGYGNQPNVMPVYLSLKNPLILDSDGWQTPLMYLDARNEDFKKRLLPRGSYDGIIVYDGTGKSKDKAYVAFKANQIKSASGNQGTFDSNNPDIRFNFKPKLGESSFAYKQRFDEITRLFQDRDIASKRMIEGTRKDGGKVNDKTDFYQDRGLRRGRIENQLNIFRKGLRSELLAVMQKGYNEKGITYEDYQDYLKARHAVQVNEYFEKLKGEKDRSGLPQKRIDEINKKIEENGWLPEMQEMAEVVDRIIQDIRVKNVAYGLITPQKFSQWKKQWKHYVPMRGFKEFEDIDPTVMVMPERQEGRASEPGDVLGYTVAMMESTIIRGESNLVLEKVANFFEQNNDRLDLGKLKNVYWRDTGKIEEETGRKIYLAETDKPSVNELLSGKVVTELNYENSITQWAERDDPFFKGARVLKILRRGKPVVVEFTAPHIAEALKNNDVDALPDFLRPLSMYMGYLRNAYITYSPEFPLRNMIRDGTTGLIHIATDFDLKTATLIANPKHLAGIATALWKALKNDDFSGKYGESIRKFFFHGGKSGYYELNQLKRLTKDLKDAVEKHGENWYKVKGILKTVHNLLQTYTSTVENLIRVSGYHHFITNDVINPKTGEKYTDKQAALYFKDLTVNFDRKGAWGGWIGTFFIFYNATIQNIARLAEPFFEGGGRRRARAAAVPLVMGAAAFYMSDMLRVLLGVDDDDEFLFDKFNDFTVTHRWFLPNPLSDDPKSVISIPLPYGQNTYWAAGVYANKVARGSMTPEEMALHLASSGWQSFNPIGGEAVGAGVVHSGLKSFLPTIAVPPFEWATNTDFRGLPIVPKQYGSDVYMPQHKNYKHFTADWAIQTARFLNRASGGDEYTEGLIEVSPNHLEFLMNSYLGGAGHFALSSIDAADKLIEQATGESKLTEDDVYRFPFVRVYFSKVPNSSSRNSFNKNADELEKMEWKYGQILDQKGSVQANKFADDNKELFRLIRFKDSTQKAISKHYRQLNMIPEEHPEQEALAEELLNRITDFYNDFNREYNTTTGKAASQNPPSKNLNNLLSP